MYDAIKSIRDMWDSLSGTVRQSHKRPVAVRLSNEICGPGRELNPVSQSCIPQSTRTLNLKLMSDGMQEQK